MSLPEFADTFQIDLRALSRVRKRFFVVGRFNQNPIFGDPEIYLFTKKPDLTEDYQKNFTRIFDMRYDNFVQALHPAIAEKADYLGRFPYVSQVVPTGVKELKGASVIDIFNYFFQRAVSNSDQPRFRSFGASKEAELLQSDKERGKSILKQIRNSLETFCAFQPRSHEIVSAFAQLLERCGMQEGLPYFAAGGPLPGGFPEKLVDFVYAENSHTRFDPKGLDFSQAQWAKLREKKAAETFCDVVSAFRDALLSNPIQQYNARRFGHHSLTDLAKASVPTDLATEFQSAREAFNSLRQILRSKVLLSMVLQWLLSSFYDLDSVAQIDPLNQFKRDQTVERLILKEGLTAAERKESAIAAPIKRPSEDERRRFSKLLTGNFERLLAAVVAPESDLERALAQLPSDDPSGISASSKLRDLAKDLRKDPGKRQALAVISGATMGEDVHKAFLDAAKTVLLDVLCPALYRAPNVTSRMLKKYFRQETMAAYLTAVFLADSNQDAVEKIAEQHINLFESKIGDATKEIRDANEMVAVLLKDFMDVVAAPEVKRRLVEGMRVLHEVLALLDAEELAEERGAGSISAILPFDTEGKEHAGSIEETPASRELIQITVHQKVAKALEQRFVSRESGESQDKTQLAEEKNQAQPQEVEAPVESATRLDQKIEEILGKVIDSAQIVNNEATPEQVRDWTAEVSAQILSDEKFVGGLAEDMKAFERTLHLIYSRYKKNPSLVTFRNKVERMTLINMMLLFQKDLGLGRTCSNLYQLLLDLVLHTNPEKVDPMDFLGEKSLTVYFDDAKLRNGGVGELRQTLEVQGISSLNNIVKFVSELRGVNYLMDSVEGDPEAEVVVVNATADEFWDWLKNDNLVANQGKGRLRSGRLMNNDQESEKVILPGLVYLTDLAFPNGDQDKESWIKGLSDKKLSEGSFRLILPPFCLSTPAQDPHGNWSTTGAAWARLALSAPAPIVVVGPSPYLNRQGDGFPTVLPAGYLLGTHILKRADPRLRNDNVAERSRQRFRVLTSAPMQESLNCVAWGEGAADDYALSVDFYLYLLLVTWSSGLGREAEAIPKDFFLWFYHSGAEVFDDTFYKSSAILNNAVLGGDAYRFALGQDVSKEDLKNVWLAREGGPDLLEAPRATWSSATNVDWFNRARSKAGLWKLPEPQRATAR